MKKKELILKRPQDFKLHKTNDPKELQLELDFKF